MFGKSQSNLVLIILLLAPLLAESSKAQWRPTNGPSGGTVTTFARMGTTIYAGTETGAVLRSTDGGDTWAFVVTSLTSLGVRALTVSDTLVFAGTGGVGVFRSVDNGANWTPFVGGLLDMEVNALASNGGVLFAGTKTRGVFRWAVSGNWSLVFPASDVRSIASSGSEIYVGAYGSGVFRSTDNGISWAAANTGLGSLNTQAITTEGNLVLAGTTGGVFRSTNRGTNWSSTNLTVSTQALGFINGTLVAGTSSGRIYRSTDGGANWSLVFNFQKSINAFVAGATYVLAGFQQIAVLRSTDNGSQWSSASLGFANVNINGLAASDSVIVAGSFDQGVYYSTDSGTNWSRGSGTPSGFVTGIASIGGSFFAGAYYGGLYRSTDGARLWTNLLSGDFVSLGASGSNLFSVISSIESYFVSRSTNQGSSWTYLGLNANVKGFAVLDSILIAGNYRSTNNGMSWATMSLPFSATAYIVVGATLLAGTNSSGVFRSTNGGNTWTPAGFPGSYVGGLTLIGSTLFAAISGSVYRSTNLGTSWISINQGLGGVGVGPLAATATDLFGGSGNGVWRRPLSEIIVGVEEHPKPLPTAYALEQNYPNPFNPSTTISFELASSSFVGLKVFDVLGREVATLLQEEKERGKHTVQFDASNISSGVYFYRIQAGDYSAQRKMLMLR